MYTSTKSHTTATFLQGALGAPVRHVDDMSKPVHYPGEGKGLYTRPPYKAPVPVPACRYNLTLSLIHI